MYVILLDSYCSEIGAHILSGNVFDPKAISELLPSTDWKSELLEQQSSHATPVRHDEFLFLTENKSYRIPSMILPKQLHNDGNYVISLGQLCRYLGTKAEEMGVEIYPGFAASEVLYNGDKSAVKGVATRDMGIDKSGKPKDTFERGVELYAKQTIFAEGARGSCSEELIKLFGLRAGKSEQTYGLGIKEVWEIPPEKMKAGFVQHTLGFPLQKKWNDKTFGGTFLYHQEPNLVHGKLFPSYRHWLVCMGSMDMAGTVLYNRCCIKRRRNVLFILYDPRMHACIHSFIQRKHLLKCVLVFYFCQQQLDL